MGMNEKKMKLTQKQELFTQNIFKGMEQTAAYLEAGYSDKQSPATLWVHASALAASDKVRIRLGELNKKAEDKTIATHKEVCQVATEIIRGRFSDFVTCGADGSYIDVGPEKIHSAAIKKVKSRTEYNEKGASPAVITDIELESRLSGIETLAKLKKWYDAQPGGNTTNTVVNILVVDSETKELMLKAKERTGKLIEGGN